MNSYKFREKPVVFNILLCICLLMIAMSVFSLFFRLNITTHISSSLLKISFSSILFIGFYKVKKWAWVLFFVYQLFSTLKMVYALLTFKMEFNIFLFISIAMSIFIIWALNVKAIRNLFQVDMFKGQKRIPGIANFAVFCFTIGFFLLTDILLKGGLGVNFIPAKMFSVFLASVYLLLGIGIWQLNKTAFQSVHPVLIFTLLTVTIVMGYDYFELKKFLALRNSMFYIPISIAMLVYWIKLIRPQLQKDHY